MSIQKWSVGLCFLAVVACASDVGAAIVTPLDGATEYHYLFVTSGATTPRQSPTTTYAFYEDFATQHVALNPDLDALSDDWYALVSTYAAPYGDGHDARSGLPTDDLPVYNTAGQFLAPSISSLWGTLSGKPGYDQNGNWTWSYWVWTGSNSQGYAQYDYWGGPLGTPGDVNPVFFVGYPSNPAVWLQQSYSYPSYQLPIYVLSGAISGLPEPSGLVVWTLLSVIGAVAWSWRRTRSTA